MPITLRPLTRDDIPAWAKVLAEAEAVDRTGEHYNEADLAEEMDNPEIEVGKDIVGAFDDGAMVGYCSVLPRGEGEGLYKVHVEGSVVPTRRGEGIGTLLCDAMVARAEAAYAERGSALPLKLMSTGKSDNSAQAGLFERAGFTAERWNFVMRTSLDDLPEAQPLPEGYAFRPYDDTLAEPMLAAHNAAFTDYHPNFTPWTETTWRQWVTESRNFRPALSYVVVVEGTDEIVGYVQSNEFDAYFEATGRREAYVAKVGVLAEHRGRGIAAALLGHCLVAYREAGFDEASLDVDSENPTGALGVYERAGFGVESRWTNYQRLSTPAR
ncbi:MAG: GNAT family N-acetyltransferase [Nocardioidaceae bacterium]|nr:GNAT family N-acetyltransferase [Nocardioidaceae bacterium]